MESVELCARLSRLARPDQHATKSSDVRATLDAVVAFYDDAASTCDAELASASAAQSAVAGMDDMVLVALQRLLLATLRDNHDSATQERAFVALALLARRCQDRLTPARIVDLLQAAALYLPTPAAALDPTTVASDFVQSKTPEELTLAVLEALRLLLSTSAAERSVQLLTVSQDSTHFLAYIVSSLLQLAERERNRSLAELAIHVLQRLLVCVAVETRVLRMFFPGVSVGMWKAMSAPLQASKVAVAALECLSFMISTCLGDHTMSDSHAPSLPQYSLERLRQLQRTPSTLMTTVTEADAWLVQAIEKVDMLLSHVLSSNAMDRQPWRVRRALVGVCTAVVLDCRASLSVSYFRCFEELMVLRTHAIAEVSQAAQDALDRLTHALPLDEWLKLEPQFAERFEMQLSTLELNCSTERESVSTHTMEVLIGYLQFQRDRFQSVVDDAMFSIVRTLSHVLAFDGFDIDLLRHERVHEASQTAHSTLVLPYFQKRFRHFHDEATVAVAMRLLRNLGAVATPAVIVDSAVTFLRAEHEAEQTDREAVLVILNECLRAHNTSGSSLPSVQDHVHLVGRVLDDLLALPLWTSTRSRDKNTTALLVECVGVCVELCGSAFDEFLLYALYPLVEKLGDPAIQVEQAALTTLQRIAAECGHNGDLHALFSANMDYFVDALCARLEQLEVYPQSPQVVEALLRHATVASLPLVDEITRSLLRAVDMYQDAPQTTTVLLRSLQLLLESFASKANAAEEVEVATPDAVTTSPLTRFLIEMRAMTEPLASELESQENDTQAQATATSAMPVEFEVEAGRGNDESDDATAGDDDKEPPPLPFQAQTVEILERCSYFVADADPMVCCLVLATMAQGVRYLRPRRKELLPLIHRLWPSILHRLTVANRPILTATMDLLATLAECAGDFIGDRFVETVWPSVKMLLASVADATLLGEGTSTQATSLTRSMLLLSTDGRSDSIQPAEDSAHTNKAVASAVMQRKSRLTLETKLLNATLRCLRTVAENAATVMSLVPEITDRCGLFLSPSFDTSTVLLTQELLLALAALNGDEVFVAMAALAQWQPPPPPSSRFPLYDADTSSVTETLHLTTRNTRSGRTEARRQHQQHCRANAAVVLEQLLHRMC